MRSLVALAVTACLVATAGLGAAPGSDRGPYTVNGVDVDAIVDRLTLEQKVGQLLLLGFGGTQMDATIETFLDDMQPGGVALFSRNIDTVEQTRALIRAVRKHDPASVPLFVAVDQEGGTVVRLKQGATVLPSAMALGAANDPDLAFRVGKALGEDLHGIGFNMNLAPVLDVNSNPKNPVIGIRSFGADPSDVAALGVAYIHGIQSAGVSAVAKHFPGHGDTDTDSHYRLPVLDHDRARLDSMELLPFSRAFAEGLDAVMTAHIALPAIAEERDMPATVSANVLTGLLREQLGYDGLVMTDGLEMQGIIDQYGSGEAAVRAVLAGADVVMVLWFPEKKREVRDALLTAARSGRLPLSRLDSAVRRVLVAKARRGLWQESAPVASSKAVDQARRALQEEVALKAITVVRDRKSTLPLGAGQKVVAAATEPVFLAALERHGAQVVRLSTAPTAERVQADAKALIARAQGADVVVVGMMTSDHAAIVRQVKQALPNVAVVAVSFGSPYIIQGFVDVDAYVCAFGFRDESEAAAAAVLTGKAQATGRLPVTLPSGEKIGSGLVPAGGAAHAQAQASP